MTNQRLLDELKLILEGIIDLNKTFEEVNNILGENNEPRNRFSTTEPGPS